MFSRWVVGGRIADFVGCCLQDLFNTVHSILVQLSSSFLSIHLVCIYFLHPYSSIDTTAAWKKLRFILSVMFGFRMTNSVSIAVHSFVSRLLISSRLLRRCLPGRWTYPLVSEDHPLDGDVASLIKTHVFCFICVDLEALFVSGSHQTQVDTRSMTRR